MIRCVSFDFFFVSAVPKYLYWHDRDTIHKRIQYGKQIRRTHSQVNPRPATSTPTSPVAPRRMALNRLLTCSSRLPTMRRNTPSCGSRNSKASVTQPKT